METGCGCQSRHWNPLGVFTMTHVRQDSVFVLCRPADVRNVGGAIRAVANAGIGAIRVVTQQTFDARDLLCYSSGATDIIKRSSLTDRMPGSNVCKFGHHFKDLPY